MNYLLVILIGVPVLEVMILVKMGAAFGFWKTFATLVAVGLAGSILARVEGFKAFSNVERALARREMPAEAMLDAALIFSAGILLAIPGFLTDAFALVLLVPFTRFWFKRWLRMRFDRMSRRSGETPFRRHFLIR